jgi:MFS family permease
MPAPATVAKEKPSRRVTLSPRASFWAAAAFAFLAFAANTAASPLYLVYENQFRFSPTTLTLLFTVYIVVLLVTLLLFGSVSDYKGRRIVMLAGLAFGAVGCGLFLIAHGVGLLFSARALQGVAVGLISGAASAALFDLRPNGGAAPVVSSAAPTGGQAVGAISASVLAQYAPAPTHLIWWLLLGAFSTGVVAVLAMPEPGTVRPGVVSSLRPHVSVPQAARGAFATAVPALVGIWALAGFYLSLGSSLAAQLLHSMNLLWGGILIFLLTGLAAAASTLLARKNPSAVMLGGCLVLIVGALMTFASIETGTSAVLFVGTAIAGLGFGPAFMGAYRVTVAAAASLDRTADHGDLHRQLPGNRHSGRARRHCHIALRPAHDRTCLFGCGRRPGGGCSQPPPGPSDGCRTGGARNPPCRRASRAGHGAAVRAAQPAPPTSESMSAGTWQ